MNEIEKIIAYNTMEELKDTLKDSGPSGSVAGLIFFIQNDPNGLAAKLAKILWKRGVRLPNILPCIVDIIELLLMHDESGGDKDVTGEGDQTW